MFYADRTGFHYFVCTPVAQYTVLVYSGFMCKSVFSDNGFVRCNVIPRKRSHGSGKLRKAFCPDTGFQTEFVKARFERHDDLFERSIARAFADTVHGAVALYRTGFKRRKCVRGGKPEIVVAMHGHRNTGQSGADKPDKPAEFIRRGISDRIGNIDGFCTAFNGSPVNRKQEIAIGSACILRGKFDIRSTLRGVCDHFPYAFEQFGTRKMQLAL